MKFKSVTLTAALLLMSAVLWAEDQPPRRSRATEQPDEPRGPRPPGAPDQPGGPRPMRGDPMAQFLFPPDLVMRAAQDIGLADDQRDSIHQEMQQAQGGFEQLHKKLQTEMEAMVALVKQERVDENQMRSQLDKVLAAENEIKKAQLTLMIHIKNRLSPDQQAKLNEMKRHMMQAGGERRQRPPEGEGVGPDEGRRPPPPEGAGERPNDRGGRRPPPSPDAPPPSRE